MWNVEIRRESGMEELARPDGEKAVLSEPLRHRLPFVSNPFLPKMVQKVPRLGGIGPSPGPATDNTQTTDRPTVSARSRRWRWLLLLLQLLLC
jgi:hypothetical protein